MTELIINLSKQFSRLITGKFIFDFLMSVKAQLNLLINGFSLEERKNIYAYLSHCLASDNEESTEELNGANSNRVTIKTMYELLAQAEEVLKQPQSFSVFGFSYTIKNKKAERYRLISKRSQYAKTRTPNAESLRPYIPQKEFEILRNAEIVKGMLGKALKYATLTGEQSKKITKLNTLISWKFFSLFMVNVPCAIYIEEILAFSSPFGIPSDSLTKSLLSICHAIEVMTPYIFFALVIYMLFFQFIKNFHPTNFRSHLDGYPLFKQHKLKSSSLALINLAIEKSLSHGAVMPNIIMRMANRYPPYISGNLKVLSSLSAAHGFSKAIGKSEMLPKELKSTILRANILHTDEGKMIESSIDAVENVLERKKTVMDQSAVIFSVMQFMLPLLILVQNIMSMDSSQGGF